jgi:hypothetical protein
MFKRKLCFSLSLSVAVLGITAGETCSLDRVRVPLGVGLVNAPTASEPIGSYKPTPIAAILSIAERASIVIPIGDAKSVKLRRVSITSSDEGTTWDGIVEETGESAMLMLWKDGRLGGVLGYKGNIYALTHSRGRLRAVIEKDVQSVRDHAVMSPHASADSTRRHRHADATSTPVLQQAAPFTNAERKSLEAKGTTIDLMVVYTKRAANHYVMRMEDLITRAVEETNQSFRNSGLENIRLRLVYTQLIDYDETNGEHFEHLYRMVDGVGTLKDVHRLRDEKRADIVGMIVDDPSGCGLSTRVAPDPEEAYFVVHHSCVAISLSIAHEIGHILGARHERGSDENESPFPYGHGHVNGTKWRDIMSYQQSCDGCRRIPYWSNPRISYQGEPTGTNDDDNARVILQQAERVANFR